LNVCWSNLKSNLIWLFFGIIKIMYSYIHIIFFISSHSLGTNSPFTSLVDVKGPLTTAFHAPRLIDWIKIFILFCQNEKCSHSTNEGRLREAPSLKVISLEPILEKLWSWATFKVYLLYQLKKDDGTHKIREGELVSKSSQT